MFPLTRGVSPRQGACERGVHVADVEAALGLETGCARAGGERGGIFQVAFDGDHEGVDVCRRDEASAHLLVHRVRASGRACRDDGPSGRERFEDRARHAFDVGRVNEDVARGEVGADVFERAEVGDGAACRDLLGGDRVGFGAGRPGNAERGAGPLSA